MTQEKKFKLSRRQKKEFKKFITPLMEAYKKETKKNV